MSSENSTANINIPQPVKTTVVSASDNANGLNEEKSHLQNSNSIISDKPICVSSKEENTGVAIKNIESESFNSLLVYDSDSSSSSEVMKLNLNWKVRNQSNSSTSSSSSSNSSSPTSSSSSSSDDDDADDDDDNSRRKYYGVGKMTSSETSSRGAIHKNKELHKTDGELLAEELPPVPDLSKLNINVENENFVHMGNVFGIVDKLVTVAAIPNTPAYDLETLLFVENGKRPLGFVFDVLGQVTSPIYAIRFNSVDDIKQMQVHVGQKVYSAPTSKHTQYVFLQQLLKMKGSDASWLGDSEVPPEFADYSDDENECFHRYGNTKLSSHVKRTHSSDSHKKFENTMNQRNILNTKFNKYMDSYKQARLNKSRAKRNQTLNTSLPAFDPSVPPPNMGHNMTFYHQSPAGGIQILPQEYMGMVYGLGTSSSATGAEYSYSQYFPQNFVTNNYVASHSQTASTNSFRNHDNGHSGPSHE